MGYKRVLERGLTFGLAGWLVATILSQHTDPSLDRVRRLDDKLGNTVIPNWRFFAPNPAVEDVRVLYRFANKDKSEHTSWMECETISPRKWSQVFWFPRRRFEKAVFDVHQALILRLTDRGGNWAGAATDGLIDMLNAYVRKISTPEGHFYWQQILLVRFSGNDLEAVPEYDAVLDYAPIRVSS